MLHVLKKKLVLIMLLEKFRQLRTLSDEGGGEGVIIKVTVGLGIFISKMKLRKR